jgi:hypothetical protein
MEELSAIKNRTVSLWDGITSIGIGTAIAGLGAYLGFGMTPSSLIGLATATTSIALCSSGSPQGKSSDHHYLRRREAAPILAPPIEALPTLDDVVNQTPPFNNYMIAGGATSLLGMPVRPANLLFNQMAADAGNIFGTTQPGQGLFAWTGQTNKIRPHIEQRAICGDTLDLSARGSNLANVYGNNVYQISYQELLDTLNSQKIFLSPDLPEAFYFGLKEALHKDQIITLPGNGRNPIKLKDLHNPNIRAFVQKARANPAAFGFANRNGLEAFLDLTIYQVGAMVVKSEDFRILMNGEGHILARNAGAPDAFRLINLCGIRSIQQSPGPANERIMRNTFITALHAAEEGVAIFPAVGMGVWQGPPEVYWPAFFDAVAMAGSNFERIFVHPMSTNTEFKKYLREAQRKYPANSNLSKIENLASRGTDVIQLAHNLKQQFPDKTISLVNASDPDVTLGNHVGEYVNNMPHHAPTTEENYTAMGTNGLCFEWITGVQNGRVIKIW